MGKPEFIVISRNPTQPRQVNVFGPIVCVSMFIDLIVRKLYT